MTPRHRGHDLLARLGDLAAVVAGIRALLAVCEATDESDELLAAESLLYRLGRDVDVLREDVDRASVRRSTRRLRG